MAENRLYDTLLALPLFLGMSRNDLRQAAGTAKFDFQKRQPGETIVREGDSCLHLYFLLSGDIDIQTLSADRAYCMEEDITAPEIFQPERIFGLNQHFTHTYTARGECSLMSMAKPEVMKLAGEQEIFRINFLNLISAQVQKNSFRQLRVPPQNLEERIIRFAETHCIRPSGEKTLHIKMTRLAEELNDSRLDISKALRRLQDEKLLSLSRGKIHIPALEKLLNRQQNL